MLRAAKGRWHLAIDIARLKREYRAVCNKCCINPDDGPASSFEVALARGELAKLRQATARYDYRDWRELRDVSVYWMSVLSYMSPGGWCWTEARLWARVVAEVRRRCPQTAAEVVEAYTASAVEDAFSAALREVLRELRADMPLRELHRRQAAKGYAVNPLRFKQSPAS
jgi:hypothetical protein